MVFITAEENANTTRPTNATAAYNPAAVERKKMLYQNDVTIVDEHLAGKKDDCLQCLAKRIG